MSSVEKRDVTLGRLQGATLEAITLEIPGVRLSFRCPDGTISEVAFSELEIMTNRGADGMVLGRLTEHVMFGGQRPSRFVFESTDGSRMLSISARISGRSLPTHPVPVEEAGTLDPLDASLATEDVSRGLIELAGLLAGKSGGVPGALSHEEEVVHSLTGIDLEVRNGGWLQWLYNTEPWRLGRAVADLHEIGLPRVAEIASKVLQIVGLPSPATLTPKERNDIVSGLPDAALRELSSLDGPYYDLEEECALSARRYVVRHRAAFDL